jgi:hypothetical protein
MPVLKFMEKQRTRSDMMRATVGRLLAALALVALFSCPGGAAIKRFTDDKGTVHITNDGSDGKPSTPPTSGAFPGKPGRVRPPDLPGASTPAPPPPPPPAAAPAQPEPLDDGGPEENIPEPEEPEEPEDPAAMPRRR